jgi:uncharacterized membrane protein HdeD (DUF308 family)
MARTQSPNSKKNLNEHYGPTFMVTWDIGMVLLIVGLMGTFIPTFLGLSLSFTHCSLLLVAGALAMWSASRPRSQAMWLNLGLGVFFLVNALLGLIFSEDGRLRVGTGAAEDMVLRLAPGFLNLKYYDHFFHLLVALFFLAEAFSWRQKMMGFFTRLSR